MNKYEILTELLSRFYGGDYKSIKNTKKEESESFRVNFGEDISLTVNTISDCIFMNVAFKETDTLQFLKDVSDQYERDKKKDKLTRAKEKLLKAQEELALLEKELEEECN